MATPLLRRFYTVTGAASGIGQCTAVRLLQLGAAGVAISDVNEAGLEKTLELCVAAGAQREALLPAPLVTVTRVDVSKRGQVESWVDGAAKAFGGRLDGAANVAGVPGGHPDIRCETIKQDEWDRTLGINLNGVLHSMRAQLPHLTRPGGSIVNVASVAGLRGLPHNAAYSTSKFGVIGLTESVAGEYGCEGIRINAVLPGPIDTPVLHDGEAKGLFTSDAAGGATFLGRVGTAEEVAKVLSFLMTDDASYVTGANWTVDGGYTAS
ncbi:hypothetical protein SCUCBS95973_006594 [Sporothrix curviconia]|uniref:Uncharacterized protein n=1 Tax=Sporothrix curviconia TaxID=1260050 RepID=A0ABP0C8K2_9PEZI